MSLVLQAVPLLVLAGIVALILRPLIARRGWTIPRPRARAPRSRSRRSNLTVVSRSRMDDELQDLLKRR